MLCSDLIGQLWPRNEVGGGGVLARNADSRRYSDRKLPFKIQALREAKSTVVPHFALRLTATE